MDITSESIKLQTLSVYIESDVGNTGKDVGYKQ